MMNATQKPQLIVFGEDWGAHPSSTQHLIRHLGDDYEVIWVNSIGLRRPRLTRHDLLRLCRKLMSRLGANAQRTNQQGAQDAAPCRLINPLVIPLFGSRLVRQLNAALLKRQLTPYIRKDSALILWSSLPSMADLVGRLGERGVVYYCGDDFRSLAGVDHGPIAAMESELAGKADKIFVASETLGNRFAAAKTEWLPHGVDYRLFSSPQPRPGDLPAEGPVAGFYGSVSEWFDVELMSHCARALPHWTFVVIGAVQTDVEPLRRLDNVRLLGPRPHHELPAYAQHWRASLLPFRRNGQIMACNPLKLREYMAAGASIVSTRFPAVESYGDLLRIADSAADFVDALKQIEACPFHASANQLRQAAAQESWSRRAQTVKQCLKQFAHSAAQLDAKCEQPNKAAHSSLI
ncbi:glycosyltransferase [Hahella sp. NBU794]|uniref:glycosyltransferase n=1 Tax=Hahella sp. NBU794 TaxID=3422590 RepID=UPI003D6F09F6